MRIYCYSVLLQAHERTNEQTFVRQPSSPSSPSLICWTTVAHMRLHQPTKAAAVPAKQTTIERVDSELIARARAIKQQQLKRSPHMNTKSLNRAMLARVRTPCIILHACAFATMCYLRATDAQTTSIAKRERTRRSC